MKDCTLGGGSHNFVFNGKDNEVDEDIAGSFAERTIKTFFIYHCPNCGEVKKELISESRNYY